MKPTRPYFLRAIYDWIIDNECTPYLAVQADYPAVDVPLEFVEDGQITLNILPAAVAHFVMDDEAVSFNARFSGVSRQLYVPMGAILGLYAKENGQGMAFPGEPFYEEDDIDDVTSSDSAPASLQSVSATLDEAEAVIADSADELSNAKLEKSKPSKSPSKKPTLTVVK